MRLPPPHSCLDDIHISVQVGGDSLFEISTCRICSWHVFPVHPVLEGHSHLCLFSILIKPLPCRGLTVTGRPGQPLWPTWHIRPPGKIHSQAGKLLLLTVKRKGIHELGNDDRGKKPGGNRLGNDLRLGRRYLHAGTIVFSPSQVLAGILWTRMADDLDFCRNNVQLLGHLLPYAGKPASTLAGLLLLLKDVMDNLHTGKILRKGPSALLSQPPLAPACQGEADQNPLEGAFHSFGQTAWPSRGGSLQEEGPSFFRNRHEYRL